LREEHELVALFVGRYHANSLIRGCVASHRVNPLSPVVLATPALVGTPTISSVASEVDIGEVDNDSDSDCLFATAATFSTLFRFLLTSILHLA